MQNEPMRVGQGEAQGLDGVGGASNWVKEERAR
jgi:hypothetical protein